MTVKDLPTSEYNPYYATYTKQVPSGELLAVFGQSAEETTAFFNAIPAEKHDYAYDEGKWTVKEVLQHIIDTERVFSYRALWFARKNGEALPGMDQNDFNDNAGASGRTMEELIAEYRALKSATLALLSSFDAEMLVRIGTASGSQMSVRAVAFIMIGHERHHTEILKARYL